MNEELKKKIWEILEENLLKGRLESTIRMRKAEFMRDWPECREYRVAGELGAGGKIWFNDWRVFVSTDSEELNEERRVLIEKVNGELDEIVGRDDIDDIIDYMFGGK